MRAMPSLSSMIFSHPPDHATVIPSPRHKTHNQLAAVSVEALEQAGQRTPAPRMQALRKKAARSGMLTPAPPSAVPDEALATRPRSKTPGRRSRSPRSRSHSPEPPQEEEEAPAPEASAKVAVIKGQPPPAKPPAPANALDAAGMISTDGTAAIPDRPPTAYDQLRHMTRRINGVFMRYERPAHPTSLDPDAEPEVEESPLFLKHTLNELIKVRSSSPQQQPAAAARSSSLQQRQAAHRHRSRSHARARTQCYRARASGSPRSPWLPLLATRPPSLPLGLRLLCTPGLVVPSSTRALAMLSRLR